MGKISLIRFDDESGLCGKLGVVSEENATHVREMVEDAIFSGCSGRQWSSDFGLGFIYGMMFAIDGKVCEIDPGKVVDYAYHSCNDFYGNSANLINIIKRLSGGDE